MMNEHLTTLPIKKPALVTFAEPQLPEHHRVDVLGVGINAINLHQTIAVMQTWMAARSTQYVCVTPAHSIMECLKSTRLRRIFNTSGLTIPDGMSIVWILQFLGQKHVDRVYGPDLLLAMCQASLEEGHRHFFYGGAPGVAEQLVENLKARWPALEVAGICSPPFHNMDPQETQATIDYINASRPDIVWVGLGSPRQEYWMAEHLGKFDATILVGVGAAFDYLSGRKRQAPVWVQRIGMEWFFRLLQEPRRLWPRYSEYPRFVWLVFRQLFGIVMRKNRM